MSDPEFMTMPEPEHYIKVVYKKVDVGHGRYEWQPFPAATERSEVNMEMSIGWGEDILENKENIEVGDKVILLDFRHETQLFIRNKPYRFYWMDRLTPYIGETMSVWKVMNKGVRLEGFDECTGFSFHWVQKVTMLPEELFEI
jgi:hypothetical protein